jgi:3-hydroxy-3-methylglutaryl CoA synthase
MVGIVAYGAYVPRLRLNRQAVYDANKWFAAGLRGLAKGERSMANWDEDSITMAVEASRDCLTSHKAEDVRNIYFASTTHPFKDRQNAGVISTALSIEQNLSASDIGGSLKAGAQALVAGLNASRDGAPSLVAAADKRMTRVASSNELNYGDGAAALLCGTENVIAKLVGHHAVSMDFVDHFRGDETDFDYGWEERWIRDEGYSKIVPPAIKAALAACKLKGADITHFIMPSLMPAVPKQMAKVCGVGDGAVRDMLGGTLGDTGAAHALVMLVDALETAKEGDKIMVVAFGQGRRRAGVRGHRREREAAQAHGRVGLDEAPEGGEELHEVPRLQRDAADRQGHARGVRQEDRAVGAVAQARHDLWAGRRQVQGMRHRAVPAQPGLRQSQLPRDRQPGAASDGRARGVGDVVHRRLAHLFAGPAGVLRHDHLPRGRALHGRLHRQRQGTGQGRRQDAHDLPHPRQRHDARRLQALFLEGAPV